jgi:predicted RNase H-like HicB family nuclease
MRYPIFIEPGDKKRAYGVVVPDLPGCFSAGDTLEKALDNAREAVATWLESQLDNGETIPAAKTVDAHLKEFKGWIPSLVDVDLSEVLGEAKRVNISLPARVLRRLDAQAEKANIDRSAYIARLTLEHTE